jgi:hypothetical protein
VRGFGFKLFFGEVCGRRRKEGGFVSQQEVLKDSIGLSFVKQ